MVSRPFFMTLPGYPGRMDENEILNDLEYLQQTGEVRRCQRRIAEILDKYDYEGSMIYDEYPDRLSLFRIADTISTILEQEAEKVSKDLIHVLVCNEIYKRRRWTTGNDCVLIGKRAIICAKHLKNRINHGRTENTFTENFE